jgi:hypothetical protein
MNVKQSRRAVPSRLGIGPMSRNVIDATIRMAYRHRRSVMVISSRNQVECEDFGGGYVEGWSTEEFTRYVHGRDPAGLLIICRDHGGPWQHPDEVASGLDEADAMARSITSLFCDIRSGVGVLHLDTSREGGGPADFHRAVRRLVTLYGQCQEFARVHGRQVIFEIGVEQQGSEADDPEEFRAKVACLVDSLAKESLQPATFVVGQTGTKVVGMENRGALVEAPGAVGTAVGKLARICWEHGLALKAHNVDYLPEYAIRELLRNGTDAVNIAPEFGVVETRAFLGLLSQLRLPQLRDSFLQLAYESGGWRKWFRDGDASDLDRSVAAGHYVFATDAFREIKRRVDEVCRRHTRTVDEVVGAALDRAMDRYAAVVWAAGQGAAPWTA